jgi:hypothetical protein
MGLILSLSVKYKPMQIKATPIHRSKKECLKSFVSAVNNGSFMVRYRYEFLI